MDADDVKKLQSDRTSYLEKAYHETGGGSDDYFEYEDIGNKLGLDETRTSKVLHWLLDKDLIKPYAGSYFGLTNRGIRIIEDAIANPDRPSGHLIALNQINIGQMINSSIQQDTTNSILNQTIQQNDLIEINKLINKLESSLEKLNLNDPQKQDLIADIETVKAQIKSTKPKKQIITESLSSISDILKALPVGQVIVTEIVSNIGHILKIFGIG